MENVPAIDLAPSFSGEPKGWHETAEAIRHACETIGFFTIVGHNIPDELVDSLKSEANAFFALPLEVKERTPQPPEKVSRGYSRLGSRAIGYSMGLKTPPDLHESYGMGPIDDPPHAIRGTDAERYFFLRNYWPAGRLAFRAAFENYYRAMEPLSLHLLRLFAHALNLDDHYFDDKVDHHTSTLRVVLYPPQETPPESGQLRAGEHTDFGTLTVLKAEDVPGGLQVKTLQGTWIDVHPAPNSFVCNIGDLMMRWTNDHWLSNVHRVANPPREFAHIGRTSITFFHNPNVDAEIRCVQAFDRRNSASKYPPVRFGEYYLSKHLKSQHMSADKPVPKVVPGATAAS